LFFFSGSNQRFSVIIGPRQGIPCALTPLEISMEITEQLKQYGPIFNVGFSPPNFAINFTSLELQLHLLSVQALTGPGFTLDILPWSYEYETFEFPWVPATSSQGTIIINNIEKYALPEFYSFNSRILLRYYLISHTQI